MQAFLLKPTIESLKKDFKLNIKKISADLFK